jgi:hypothetical protein
MEFFRILNATGIRIHLFVSPEYADMVEVTHGVKEVIQLEELDTYRVAPRGLPETRNETHDTRNFLILMNAKIELVTRAMDSGRHSGMHYAWIDFNIFHVLNEERGIEQLRSLSTRVYPDTCMYVPGCWGKGVIWSSVNWRFCGGFFLGDVASLNAFYFAHRSEFPLCPHLWLRPVHPWWCLLQLS